MVIEKRARVVRAYISTGDWDSFLVESVLGEDTLTPAERTLIENAPPTDTSYKVAAAF